MGITASVLRDSRYAPVDVVDTRLTKEQVVPCLGCIRHGLRNAIAEIKNGTKGGQLDWNWTGLAGATTTIAPPTTPLHSTSYPNPADDDVDYISCVIRDS